MKKQFYFNDIHLVGLNHDKFYDFVSDLKDVFVKHDIEAVEVGVGYLGFNELKEFVILNCEIVKNGGEK